MNPWYIGLAFGVVFLVALAVRPKRRRRRAYDSGDHTFSSNDTYIDHTDADDRDGGDGDSGANDSGDGGGGDGGDGD